jgi:DNA-binding protein HU-beta
MKKTGLIEEVMSAAGIESKKDAKAAVEAVFEVIVKTMGKGENVGITGFGTFRVAKRGPRAAREGINPRTGEKIMISAKPASVKPKFSPGKLMKEAVN